MSRFLVGTIPVASYISPMLPIIHQLVERGHEVWWYTGELFQDEIESSGAQFVGMTAALDFSIVEKVPSDWGPQRQDLKGLAQLRFDLKHFFIDHAIGQAHFPQTYREPYWETFLDRPLTADGKGHYVINFSYGSRLDPKFKKALLELLPASR